MLCSIAACLMSTTHLGQQSPSVQVSAAPRGPPGCIFYLTFYSIMLHTSAALLGMEQADALPACGCPWFCFDR